MKNNHTIKLLAGDDDAGLLLVAHAASTIRREKEHLFYLTYSDTEISLMLHTREAMDEAIRKDNGLKNYYRSECNRDNLDECGRICEEACKAAGLPCDFRVQHGEEAGKGQLVLACGYNNAAVFVPVTFDEAEFQAVAREQREEEVEGGAA